MSYTRREVGQLLLAGLPVAWLARAAGAQKPNSRFAGVQVGLNVPYNFTPGNYTMTGDEVLARTLQLGVSALETRSQPAELFMGAPAAAFAPNPGRGATPDQLAAHKAADDALQAWRLNHPPLDKARAYRKTYADAGVAIEIVKFDGIYALTDPGIDYCFELTKALGARVLSTEISRPDTKRLGQFADKHQIMVGYHGHTETTPAHWEAAFAEAKFNGANLDLGHFVAGNNMSPLPFLTQYHDRITHVHVKDKKMHDGPNMAFGEGETPIVEVLRAIRDHKWNIQATIEFEYPVPPGSDRMAEMAKCVAYCRKALES